MSILCDKKRSSILVGQEPCAPDAIRVGTAGVPTYEDRFLEYTYVSVGWHPQTCLGVVSSSLSGPNKFEPATLSLAVVSFGLGAPPLAVGITSQRHGCPIIYDGSVHVQKPTMNGGPPNARGLLKKPKDGSPTACGGFLQSTTQGGN